MAADIRQQTCTDWCTRQRPCHYVMPQRTYTAAEDAAWAEAIRWRALTIAERRAEIGEAAWARRTAPIAHADIAAMVGASRNRPEAMERWSRRNVHPDDMRAAIALHWMDLAQRAAICNRKHVASGFRYCIDVHAAAAWKDGYRW
jgi:hypothetical protein